MKTHTETENFQNLGNQKFGLLGAFSEGIESKVDLEKKLEHRTLR